MLLSCWHKHFSPKVDVSYMGRGEKNNVFVLFFNQYLSLGEHIFKGDMLGKNVLSPYHHYFLNGDVEGSGFSALYKQYTFSSWEHGLRKRRCLFKTLQIGNVVFSLTRQTLWIPVRSEDPTSLPHANFGAHFESWSLHFSSPRQRGGITSNLHKVRKCVHSFAFSSLCISWVPWTQETFHKA